MLRGTIQALATPPPVAAQSYAQLPARSNTTHSHLLSIAFPSSRDAALCRQHKSTAHPRLLTRLACITHRIQSHAVPPCRVRRSTGACSPSPMHRAVLLHEGVSLELPRKQGMFRLEARDVSGSRGGAAAGRGTLLGSCQLWVAASRDGSTLFWSHDRCVTTYVMKF
jgi:hypothetical protein